MRERRARHASAPIISRRTNLQDLRRKTHVRSRDRPHLDWSVAQLLHRRDAGRPSSTSHRSTRGPAPGNPKPAASGLIDLAFAHTCNAPKPHVSADMNRKRPSSRPSARDVVAAWLLCAIIAALALALPGSLHGRVWQAATAGAITYPCAPRGACEPLAQTTGRYGASEICPARPGHCRIRITAPRSLAGPNSG
jgi:hypothetical protein